MRRSAPGQRVPATARMQPRSGRRRDEDPAPRKRPRMDVAGMYAQLAALHTTLGSGTYAYVPPAASAARAVLPPLARRRDTGVSDQVGDNARTRPEGTASGTVSVWVPPRISTAPSVPTRTLPPPPPPVPTRTLPLPPPPVPTLRLSSVPLPAPSLLTAPTHTPTPPPSLWSVPPPTPTPTPSLWSAPPPTPLPSSAPSSAPPRAAETDPVAATAGAPAREPWTALYEPRVLEHVVGNRTELRRIVEWMAAACARDPDTPRGLIVAGPPGIGKTCAVRAAAASIGAVVEEYGVWSAPSRLTDAPTHAPNRRAGPSPGKRTPGRRAGPPPPPQRSTALCAVETAMRSVRGPAPSVVLLEGADAVGSRREYAELRRMLAPPAINCVRAAGAATGSETRSAAWYAPVVLTCEDAYAELLWEVRRVCTVVRMDRVCAAEIRRHLARVCRSEHVDVAAAAPATGAGMDAGDGPRDALAVLSRGGDVRRSVALLEEACRRARRSTTRPSARALSVEDADAAVRALGNQDVAGESAEALARHLLYHGDPPQAAAATARGPPPSVAPPWYVRCAVVVPERVLAFKPLSKHRVPPADRGADRRAATDVQWRVDAALDLVGAADDFERLEALVLHNAAEAVLRTRHLGQDADGLEAVCGVARWLSDADVARCGDRGAALCVAGAACLARGPYRPEQRMFLRLPPTVLRATETRLRTAAATTLATRMRVPLRGLRHQCDVFAERLAQWYTVAGLQDLLCTLSCRGADNDNDDGTRDAAPTRADPSWSRGERLLRVFAEHRRRSRALAVARRPCRAGGETPHERVDRLRQRVAEALAAHGLWTPLLDAVARLSLDRSYRAADEPAAASLGRQVWLPTRPTGLDALCPADGGPSLAERLDELRLLAESVGVR